MRRARSFLLVFAGVWFWPASLVNAQDAPKVASWETPEVPLRLRETIPVPSEISGGVATPVKCDLEGNLYFQRYNPAAIFWMPIEKISPDGKKVARFDVRKAPGFEKGEYVDYTVGLRGQFFFLAIRKKEEKIKVAIVRFDKEGSFDSLKEIDQHFYPSKLVAFQDGNFLVSGTRTVKEAEPGKDGVFEPFVAVLDQNGKLVKQADLGPKGRPKPDEAAKQGSDSPPKENSETRDLLDGVTMGSAQAATDGNIYLFTWAQDPVVYVVASDGSILRQFTFHPPRENFQAYNMKVAGGKILIEYQDEKSQEAMTPEIYSVADAETGEVLVNYLSTPKFGGALACYTPNGLTFLGVENGKFAIQRTYALNP